MSPVYTVADAAEELHISTASVRRVAKALKVGSRFGKVWMFTEADIEAMSKRPTVPGPKPGSKKRGEQKGSN